MRYLFRSLDAHGVRYLVISGQASVIYGAALFSEDLDLWVEPTPRNIRALIRALGKLGARVHKLTPPLTAGNLRRGHGFHFVIPGKGSNALHLDVMGRPPRVGGFAASLSRAEHIPTRWGNLPVVSLEDLVELKKTNRPADYEIITNLSMIRIARRGPPSRRALRWALRNIFRAEDLWKVVRQWGSLIGPRERALSPAVRMMHGVWRRGGTPSLRQLARASRLLSVAAQAHQDRGRAYWLPLIADLRRMHAGGGLLEDGIPVAAIAKA
jgi:hypothetical protein